MLYPPFPTANKLHGQTNAGLSEQICEATGFWKLRKADVRIKQRGMGAQGEIGSSNHAMSDMRPGGRRNLRDHRHLWLELLKISRLPENAIGLYRRDVWLN